MVDFLCFRHFGFLTVRGFNFWYSSEVLCAGFLDKIDKVLP